MSTGELMDLQQARAEAEPVLDALRPASVRLEVAGSIRRQRPSVGDVDVVLIPRMEPDDLFGQTVVAATAAVLRQLESDGRLAKIMGGDRMAAYEFCRRGQHIGLRLNTFVVCADTWGVQLAIRTGPHWFSKLLVTQRQFGGFLANDLKVADGRVWRGGIVLPTPEEEDFLLLACGHRPPNTRDTKTATDPRH